MIFLMVIQLFTHPDTLPLPYLLITLLATNGKQLMVRGIMIFRWNQLFTYQSLYLPVALLISDYGFFDAKR